MNSVCDAPEKDAYICYNSADVEWVERLAAHLESETIDGTPNSRKLRVFFDKWDMTSGDNLIRKMNEGMNASKFLIAVLSPEFLNADWPHFEWTHFVAQDPTNRRSRLIPIRLRDVSLNGDERINLCAPFVNLKHVDFRKEGDFKRSLVELANKIRNMPPTRGKQYASIAGITKTTPSVPIEDAAWMPDHSEEHLFGNLFPVIQFPARIWTASTSLKTKKEVWAQVSTSEGFVLRENAIFTFGDLKESYQPLRDVIDVASIRELDTRRFYDDPVKSKWFIELLNTNLRSYLNRRYVRSDGKGRFYFLLEKNGADRNVAMPGGRPRTVAKEVKNEEKGLHFYVHQAASLRFRKFDARFFLSVSPLYMFTTDGTASISGKSAGKLSQLWMGKQQNDAIFRDILFWVYFLSDGKDEVRLTDGPDPVRISSTPASTLANWGISWDSIQIKTLFQHREDDLSRMGEELTELEDENEDCTLA